MEDDKNCPLLMVNGGPYDNELCIKDKCAWWSFEQCAIVAISESILAAS